MKRALICGVSGQDGAYLSKLLLEKGYEVFGTSRSHGSGPFPNLAALGIGGQVRTISLAKPDIGETASVVDRVRPDEIYNLSGQSSVGRSFEHPAETMQSIADATLCLLEAVRLAGGGPRVFNAGSGECFGDTGPEPADEQSPFRPRSPYAVAKCAAHWQVANYREAYGLFACTGILFNHESPLRPARFVTQKIVQTARRIASGSGERLELGNTRIVRDWGWAPEYVEAMWLMLQQEKADDYVVATGRSVSLEEFVAMAFGQFGLDWRPHVAVNLSLFRPLDIPESRANPGKAARVLGWTARTQVEELIARLAAA